MLGESGLLTELTCRGLLSGWTQMMISWGFFAANWIGYGCQFINGTGQFRVPLAIQIVPAVVLLV
mgnify:CR=1 FL=1|jgi:hypothetical protein